MTVFALVGVLTLAVAPVQRGANSRVGNLQVGDPAPLFKLSILNEKTKAVELAQNFGKLPTVLIFGSYT